MNTKGREWLRGISYAQQERYRIVYKGEVVGEYVPDLVVARELIVDVKTIERITDHERGQALNYLRITGFAVAIILNFKHARLEWERVILTAEPRTHSNLDWDKPPDFSAPPVTL